MCQFLGVKAVKYDILEDQVVKVFKHGRVQGVQVAGRSALPPFLPCLPLIALDCQPVSDEPTVTN